MPVPATSLPERVGQWLRQARALTGWDATRVLRQVRTARGRTRWELVRTLRELPLRGGHVSALVALLDEGDALLRWEIEEVLSHLPPHRVAPACLLRLEQGEPEEGLASCIRVLAALKADNALDTIVRYQGHPSVHVRVAVADALAHFVEHVQAQNALIQLLRDPEPAVRRAAVWTLRRSNVPWAGPVLEVQARERPEPWCASRSAISPGREGGGSHGA